MKTSYSARTHPVKLKLAPEQDIQDLFSNRFYHSDMLPKGLQTSFASQVFISPTSDSTHFALHNLPETLKRSKTSSLEPLTSGQMFDCSCQFSCQKAGDVHDTKRNGEGIKKK